MYIRNVVVMIMFCCDIILDHVHYSKDFWVFDLVGYCRFICGVAVVCLYSRLFGV